MTLAELRAAQAAHSGAADALVTAQRALGAAHVQHLAAVVAATGGRLSRSDGRYVDVDIGSWTVHILVSGAGYTVWLDRGWDWGASFRHADLATAIDGASLGMVMPDDVAAAARDLVARLRGAP